MSFQRQAWNPLWGWWHLFSTFLSSHSKPGNIYQKQNVFHGVCLMAPLHFSFMAIISVDDASFSIYLYTVFGLCYWIRKLWPSQLSTFGVAFFPIHIASMELYSFNLSMIQHPLKKHPFELLLLSLIVEIRFYIYKMLTSKMQKQKRNPLAFLLFFPLIARKSAASSVFILLPR